MPSQILWNFTESVTRCCFDHRICDGVVLFPCMKCRCILVFLRYISPWTQHSTITDSVIKFGVSNQYLMKRLFLVPWWCGVWYSGTKKCILFCSAICSEKYLLRNLKDNNIHTNYSMRIYRIDMILYS